MKKHGALLIGLLIWTIFAGASRAADSTPADSETYLLRYKFQAGETLRWKVVDRKRTSTTISGSTQVAETINSSIKAWTVREVLADGTATFEHLVESADMWQKLEGGEEVRYNSTTDEEPPAIYQTFAKSIGVGLSVVTLSATGEVLARKRNTAVASVANEGQITIPLPRERVPVGHTWSFSHQVSVPLPSGAVKKVKTSQKFTLASVKHGVAVIEVANQILTPIHDPAIESQLIHRQSSGTVRFDVDAGRVLRQRMDLDKRVVGFHTAASSLHYLTRFTEEFLPEDRRTANRPETPGSKTK